MLAFCAQGTRGFSASPELQALPLPIRTLKVWIPEATTFAHLARYSGRKKSVVLLPWRLMMAMKGNSWIWILVCLLIYLLLCSTVGKYFHFPPCQTTLFIAAGTRVQNWTVRISPQPGSLLGLSEMLRGWEKTCEGFAREKQPPLFSKATTTSSRSLGIWGAPRPAMLVCNTSLAELPELALPRWMESMPCHSACSPCLLLYPVCELLTLIAPSPRPCSPPYSKLQDSLVFLGIRQCEGFLLIGINNLKGHIFPPLQRELGGGCVSKIKGFSQINNHKDVNMEAKGSCSPAVWTVPKKALGAFLGKKMWAQDAACSCSWLGGRGQDARHPDGGIMPCMNGDIGFEQLCLCQGWHWSPR